MDLWTSSCVKYFYVVCKLHETGPCAITKELSGTWIEGSGIPYPFILKRCMVVKIQIWVWNSVWIWINSGTSIVILSLYLYKISMLTLYVGISGIFWFSIWTEISKIVFPVIQNTLYYSIHIIVRSLFKDVLHQMHFFW